MAPRFWLLISSGSKKKKPRCACLIEAKASHRQRTWTEVSSSSSPRLLHSGLSVSPVRWRCLRRVLCPVRSPVTTLDCDLLKDKNLTLVPRQGPDIKLEPVVGKYQRSATVSGAGSPAISHVVRDCVTTRTRKEKIQFFCSLQLAAPNTNHRISSLPAAT
jgi:hypothetical protein